MRRAWRFMSALALLLAAGTLLITVVLFARVTHVQTDQRKGRALTVTVTCSALSAVIDAGRATITGGGASTFSPAFERNLIRLGYPPRRKRRAAARAAADAYSREIANRVAEATGSKGKGLVTKTGTLNCRKLKEVAAVDQTP